GSLYESEKPQTKFRRQRGSSTKILPSPAILKVHFRWTSRKYLRHRGCIGCATTTDISMSEKQTTFRNALKSSLGIKSLAFGGRRSISYYYHSKKSMLQFLHFRSISLGGSPSGNPSETLRN